METNWCPKKARQMLALRVDAGSLLYAVRFRQRLRVCARRSWESANVMSRRRHRLSGFSLLVWFAPRFSSGEPENEPCCATTLAPRLDHPRSISFVPFHESAVFCLIINAPQGGSPPLPPRKKKWRLDSLANGTSPMNLIYPTVGSHHFDTIANHCLLVFSGEASIQGFFRWCLRGFRVHQQVPGLSCARQTEDSPSGAPRKRGFADSGH